MENALKDKNIYCVSCIINVYVLMYNVFCLNIFIVCLSVLKYGANVFGNIIHYFAFDI